MKQVLFGMLLCLPFTACNDDVEEQSILPTMQPIELNATEKEMAAQQGDFASTLSLELCRQLGGEKMDNWLVSPFSLQCALGMLSNGANRETREEILHALGLSQYSQEEVNAYFKKLIEGLHTVNSAITVKTANSVWGNAGVPLKDDFQKMNIENYSAMVSQLDFSDPSAVDQINAWCNQTTEGLIPSILDEVNPTATVYLLNSLYFKARWESEFAPEKTQEGDFNTSSGKVVKADFMQTQRMAAYVENEWFTSTSLSYQNDSYVMRLILPQPEISIDQVLQALSESDGNLWKNVILADINLKMPRFTLENKMDLIPALQALGMKTAFTNEADFSSMSDIATYISLVQQATRLKVDEEGSEGAAVTVIEGDLMSPLPEEKVDFFLDRPFLFQIIESSTGTVLFMGQVGSPV
ncbi:MAG: serpin family protein [Parabacteroides sp.]|jgi:serine protease inhibitor|nr:serpin family protein [Parabacteroides sp.]MDY5622526.1 serpin family protein [Bacteroidales bacterium]